MMTQLPVKKRRPPRHEFEPPANPEDVVRFPDVVLCLVEKRMGSSRRLFLTNLARRRGFCVEDADSERLTHVVSEGISGDEVLEWLKKNGRRCVDAVGSGPALLDLDWFTESMAAGRPVEVEPRHRLRVTVVHAEDRKEKYQVAANACQRRTPLAHSNQALTEALETVAEEALFWSSEGRSLAFSRAASVLKALPCAVKRVGELDSVPCIGAHSRKIIQEVLEDGASAEVEKVKQSERYRTMKLFTKIFGVGVKTASLWYQEGLRTLSDLQARHAKLSKEQQVGLLHYEDLNTPVERSEAEAIGTVVRDAVERFLPGASVTLTGGFRRGKQTGHDVDFLISYPVEGQEVGLLSKVISWLHHQGFLLYHSSQKNTYQVLEDQEPLQVSSSSSNPNWMDRYERSFCIFCLDSLQRGIQRDSGVPMAGNIPSDVKAKNLWKAVRVDLVVAPFSQFSFALLGWTGSRNFERDLRRFSKHVKKMVLNSHALYHLEQKKYLPAASEEEIFKHLDLEYIPPEERNA